MELSKSPQGSCVLKTDCAGVDTSKFEFSFDCESSPGNRLRHSFGVGGFDDQEEFDTSIKCSKCIEPVPVSTHMEVPPAKANAANQVPVTANPVHAPTSVIKDTTSNVERMNSRGPPEPTTSMHVHFLAGAAQRKVEDATVAKYGPANCVSTWRNADSGHCTVETKCSGQDTSKYMFGLICLDDKGIKTRHLFGVDSFDSEETFDTLIVCKECLALDNVTKATELEAENAELAGEVNALATEVGSIKNTFQDLDKDVKKLKETVAAKEGGSKEGEGEKKDAEKKEPEKKEGEAATTELYLTDRDVDENLPSDSIAKSHLKGSASHVKRQRKSQKKKRQRHQKSQDVIEQDEDDDDDEENEDAKPTHTFSKKAAEKADSNDDYDESSDDEADD